MSDAAAADFVPHRIAVLGAGSWGTALAWLLAEGGNPVTLWGRDATLVAAIERARENIRYLPGVPLPANVTATADLATALAAADAVVLAVPAQAVRAVMTQARDRLPPRAGVLVAAKGLEVSTGLRLTEVVAATGPPGILARTAVMSGPNLAGEIVRRMPTVTVVASANPRWARAFQATLAAPFFRVYLNPDVTGVELGGALKNPIALAAGISDGLGFGQNTKAALLTRGLAEMTRLGVAAGAQAATFAGLSGLGDLVATAHSPLSRNYRLGLALGRGQPLATALADLGHVAEGVPTTEAACRLAERLGVEIPITAELRRVLFEGRSPREAVIALMTRAFREEG